jgi:hypothetical protein
MRSVQGSQSKKMRPSPIGEFFIGDDYEPAQWTNQAHVAEPRDHDTPSAGGAEDEEEQPEHFDPRPLKSRRLELERLGEAPDRASCFGCVYLDDNDTLLPSEELKRLKEMARQSIGRIDLITLAEAMHDYYERNVRQPIGGRLPDWPASQILEHIRHHNQDPLVQQVVLLAETQELRTELLERCFEVSSRTGKSRPNKHNIECYEKIVKLQLHIQKQDASKMAFYHGGSNVNPEILSQGLLSTHTKHVHSYWKIK